MWEQERERRSLALALSDPHLAVCPPAMAPKLAGSAGCCLTVHCQGLVETALRLDFEGLRVDDGRGIDGEEGLFGSGRELELLAMLQESRGSRFDAGVGEGLRAPMSVARVILSCADVASVPTWL